MLHLLETGTWWNPLIWFYGIFGSLLLAGIFTRLLKMVFSGLFSMFGSVVAFTGVYSTEIIALDMIDNTLMTWLHLPHRSDAGVGRA